ncbi:MAG: molybdopterin molybdotransferase MoeA [Roseovarius sp.]|nr:molybdopterin molybdotransferase MoeA [Roseovarius sp.]
MSLLQPLARAGCGCDAPGPATRLVSVDEALACIAANAAAVGETEEVALPAALGRVLARAVRSQATAPPFDNAAMDGYAVATGALTGEGPWTLAVAGRIPAGQAAAAPVGGLRAARIFTGAPIPEGADAVVMQEDVRREGERVTLTRKPSPGLNIRRAGSDMAAGETVLKAGRRLGPREIAACAAAGQGRVVVHRCLRVGLLVTGDEVCQAGTRRDAAQIWDINTPLFSATLAETGAELVAVASGADRREALARQLADIAGRADLVVTTGGISVGEEDHVKPALADLGAEVLFSGVAVKPGKPVSFGRLGRAYWLGLPGNPLSAYVTWQLFGTALVRRLAGEHPAATPRRHVVTADAIRRKPGRCELRPATLAGFDAEGREVVTFDDAIHSGRVAPLPRADGLILLPAETDVLPAGALVEFQPFSRN